MEQKCTICSVCRMQYFRLLIPNHQSSSEGEGESFSEQHFSSSLKELTDSSLICVYIITDLYSYLANSLFDWFPSGKWLRAMAVQTNWFYSSWQLKEAVFVYYTVSDGVYICLCLFSVLLTDTVL